MNQLLLVVLLVYQQQHADCRIQYMHAIVVSVVDGDTLMVKEAEKEQTQKPFRVRLLCIDAPEQSQRRWGKIAMRSLRRYLPIGSRIRLKIYSKDFYGRSLCEVFDQQGNNLALRLLDDGVAVLYPHRDRNACGKRYTEAEERARVLNRGLWADESFIHPFEYKKLENVQK